MKRVLAGIGVVLAAVAGAAFAFLFLGSSKEAEQIAWGATFSHSQAESLGLDWQETYLALLDGLGVRNFRLPLYWDELEPQDDRFDFAPWDWQVAELEKRGGRAFLAIGMKLPRWPECRMPSWAKALPRQEREEEILEMLEAVVAHYKDRDAVWAWQVENEPFLTFGDCPENQIDPDFLDAEIALVREADASRPVILSDTGENSLWLEMGKRADVFSSTLFRVVHDPRIGFVRYPYPPVMYGRKASWLRFWRPDVRVIVGELQAEPWVITPPISSSPLQEQEQTMNPERFADVISYAKATGLDEFYFWGAEWWYWLKKEQGEERIWELARQVFR